MDNSVDTFIKILQIGTNSTLIILAVKLIFHLGKMEQKVDTMWDYFKTHFVLKSLAVFLIVSASLGLVACKKPTLRQLLVAGQYSIEQACSEEWLDTIECNRALSGIKISIDIVDKNQPNVIKNVLNYLTVEEESLPTDSKIRPYWDWIIKILRTLA